MTIEPVMYVRQLDDVNLRGKTNDPHAKYAVVLVSDLDELRERIAGLPAQRTAQELYDEVVKRAGSKHPAPKFLGYPFEMVALEWGLDGGE